MTVIQPDGTKHSIRLDSFVTLLFMGVIKTTTKHNWDRKHGHISIQREKLTTVPNRDKPKPKLGVGTSWDSVGMSQDNSQVS